jgi:hypothetical protein
MIKTRFEVGNISFPSFGSFPVISWIPFGNKGGVVVRIIIDSDSTKTNRQPKSLKIGISSKGTVVFRNIEILCDPTNDGLPFWTKALDISLPSETDLKAASKNVYLVLKGKHGNIDQGTKEFLSSILASLPR